jgi:site-specific DNA-cytosine methylase
MKPLDDFIINKTIKNIKKNKQLEINLKKINYEENCIVTSCNYYFPIKYISPTLTTYCSIYYHTTYKRYLTTKECLLLQGFPINFKQVVSNHQMFKQTGNSMSVNVLKVLFKKIFIITNI